MRMRVRYMSWHGQEAGAGADAVEASQPAPRPASKPDIPRAPFPSWGP